MGTSPERGVPPRNNVPPKKIMMLGPCQRKSEIGYPYLREVSSRKSNMNSGEACGVVLRIYGSGFRDCGFQALGIEGLGFRVLGFRV